MENTQPKTQKVTVTMRITKEAHGCLFELTSQRGVGDLVSQLVVDFYHARKGKRVPSPREIAAELRAMADKLDSLT